SGAGEPTPRCTKGRPGHEPAVRRTRRPSGGLGLLLRAHSLADIAVAPDVAAASFLGFGPDPDRHPRLLGWLGRVQQRPMVRDNADVLELSRDSNERERPGSTPIACNAEAIASSG